MFIVVTANDGTEKAIKTELITSFSDYTPSGNNKFTVNCNSSVCYQEDTIYSHPMKHEKGVRIGSTYICIRETFTELLALINNKDKEQ